MSRDSRSKPARAETGEATGSVHESDGAGTAIAQPLFEGGEVGALVTRGYRIHQRALSYASSLPAVNSLLADCGNYAKEAADALERLKHELANVQAQLKAWRDAACTALAATPDPTGSVDQEVLEALYQYESDLLHPPQGDSIGRRLERVRSVIAKARGEAA